MLYLYMSVSYPDNYDVYFLWFITQGSMGIVISMFNIEELIAFRCIFSMVWFAIVGMLLLQPQPCNMESIWGVTVGETALWSLFLICRVCRIEERMAEI